jgi:hypothetical protein
MSTRPIPLHIWYVDPDSDPLDFANKLNWWDLSDQSMSKGYVCSAIAGIEGLPVMMQTVPLLNGTSVPMTYIPQTGTIGLAILVGRPANTDSQIDYYNMLDQVVRAFYNRRNQRPAPGYMVIQRPDTSYRQIAVYTTSGLNTPEVGINDLTLYTISLSTPDPFWSGSDFITKTFQTGTSNGILPLLPIALNAAHAIGGGQPVFIFGDMPSYPTWVITGPGTPTITNNTTDRSWGLSAAIPAGQRVQVKTTPGKQSVINTSTGANWWGNLVFTGPHDIWPLIQGYNYIDVDIPDATAATSAQMSYYNKWARA